MDLGLVGGIAGGVAGLVGGVVGTYVSLKKVRGPRERALAIRLVVAIWLWLSAMMAWIFLVPRPWGHLVLLFHLPLMAMIAALPRINRALARAQDEDEAGR